MGGNQEKAEGLADFTRPFHERHERHERYPTQLFRFVCSVAFRAFVFRPLRVLRTLRLTSVDYAPNERLIRSSIARLPFACIFRVPVPVKCTCVMIGALAELRFSHSSPVHENQLFFS